VRFIRLDLPGFGGTPAAGHPGPNIEGMARFVCQALDALDLQGAVVLGHSLGGPIAAAAVAGSSRAAGLALVNSVGPVYHRGHFTRTSRLLVRFADRPLVSRLMLWLARPIMRAVGFSKHLNDDELKVALRCSVSFDPDAHARRLTSLGKPVFVTWADDDPSVQASVSRALVALLPGARHLHFETGGHNLQKSRAVEIAEALLPWIDEVAAARVHQSGAGRATGEGPFDRRP